MTVFARISLPPGKSEAIQKAMAELQMALGAPRDLMMFSTPPNAAGLQTLYIALPNAALLTSFKGFDPIERDALPAGLTTVVCREDGFAERFPDIERKRRFRG